MDTVLWFDTISYALYHMLKYCLIIKTLNSYGIVRYHFNQYSNIKFDIASYETIQYSYDISHDTVCTPSR